MASQSTVEYRPTRSGSLTIAGIWIGTAALLAWLGVILGPQDREAMDGFTLLLFTVVPIRLFSWTMAAGFLIMGGVILRRGLGGPPTLVMSREGLRLRSGRQVPWRELRSVGVTPQGILAMELGDGSKVSLSSFELGAEPGDLAAEVQRRMAP